MREKKRARESELSEWGHKGQSKTGDNKTKEKRMLMKKSRILLKRLEETQGGGKKSTKEAK